MSSASISLTDTPRVNVYPWARYAVIRWSEGLTAASMPAAQASCRRRQSSAKHFIIILHRFGSLNFLFYFVEQDFLLVCSLGSFWCFNTLFTSCINFSTLLFLLSRSSPIRYPHLSIIQVTEASDDLLFVELISFELHAPHSLHDAVILQALLPSQLRLHRRPLLQAVQVTFLLAKNKHYTIKTVLFCARDFSSNPP